MKPSVLSKSNLFLRFWIALAVVLAFGAVIRKINDFSKTPLQTTDGRTFVKAEVVEIVKDNADETGNRNGYQTVMLEILEGAHKGEKLEASSSSSYLYGTVCQVGMKVIAILSESPNEVYLSVYSFYRTPVLYVIILLFFLSIYLVGRKQGLRAIAGLVFTCFCIWYLFLPLVYQGYSPVWCAVFTCIVTTAVTIYFIWRDFRQDGLRNIGNCFGCVYLRLSVPVVLQNGENQRNECIGNRKSDLCATGDRNTDWRAASCRDSDRCFRGSNGCKHVRSFHCVGNS